MRRYSIRPRFYIYLCVAMLLFFAASFGVSYARLSSELEALDETMARRAEASVQMAHLQEQLDYAGTDEYVERAARDRLGMLYPGEYRYVGN